MVKNDKRVIRDDITSQPSWNSRKVRQVILVINQFTKCCLLAHQPRENIFSNSKTRSHVKLVVLEEGQRYAL